MKLHTINPNDSCCATIRVVAETLGQKLDLNVVDASFKKNAAFLKLNSTGSLPLLETKEGGLQESLAICKYLCALNGNKLLGESALEKSLVDQWLAYLNTTIIPCVDTVNAGIFGSSEVEAVVWNEAAKNLKAYMKVLNQGLEGKKWLCGNEMTVADLALAVTLQTCF